MKTFAEKIIEFNQSLDFHSALPEGIRIMNPFREDPNIVPVSSAFYTKFYNDTGSRHLILGINPGRFGAGLTGIPFTDPKRLTENCGIAYHGIMAHEPSSVFIYDMIEQFGGVREFYSHFFVNAVCPLGFTLAGDNGREINYNYYDSKELIKAVNSFIIESILKLIAMGVETDICFCLGRGKNEKFLRQLNASQHFFGEIVALEHPRFIIQYKSKTKQEYIDKYIRTFRQIL